MDKGVRIFRDLFLNETHEIFRDANRRTVTGTQKRSKAVLANSPVDEGEFVADWDAAKNRPPTQGENPDDPKKRATAARIIAVINTAQFGDKLFYENRDEVAVRLEFGYSKQAPQGVTRLAARQWRRQVRNAGRAAQRRIGKKVIEQ